MSLIIPLGTNLSSGVTSRSAFSDSFLGNDCRHVTQSGHGFNPLDAIRYNGTTWVKAISTSESTLADGLVIYVIGDSFFWASSGVYTLTGHGLILNSKYYLTDTSGSSDTTPGTYSQYLFTPLTANEIVVGISANQAISTPLSAGQIGYASGVTSLTGSNNLFYDSANTRLSVGIGTSPSESIHTNGNILIDAASERGLMVKYSGDLNGNANISNPIWTLGRLVEGGVADHSVFRYVFYSDDQGVERSVFEVEDTGTIASVSDGTRRSHVEGFLNNGDTQPIFRLSSSVGSGDMGLQMGVGGTTAPDVEFARNGSNSAYLALGGSAKTIWYADAFVYQPGINAVLANTAGLNPELRFMEEDGNGSNYVGFKAPASVATNKIWTLPNADSTGTQSLVSNGSGALSFASFLPISGGTLTGALTLSGDPVNPLEPVTKQYLEAVMQSWKWKSPNAAVTDPDANVDVTTALAAGNTLNGLTLSQYDLVLLRTQTDPAENGLWEVPATGAATRPTIFDTWQEVVGAAIIVSQGTVYADTIWLCTNDSGGTLGTTAITFTRIPTGAGLTGTFSGGQVAYANGTTSLTGTNNFYFDGTNIRLGLGISNPNRKIQLHETDTPIIQWTNSTTGSTSADGSYMGLNPDGSLAIVQQESGQYVGVWTGGTLRQYTNDNGFNLNSNLHMSTFRIGFNGVGANHEIHLHSAANPGIQFTQTSTGSASGDGSKIILDTDGSLAIAQFETGLEIRHYTAGVDRFTIGDSKITARVPLNVHYTGSSIQFTDSVTGTTANDGFSVGIDGSQNAYLYQAENKSIRIVTNATDRGVFQNDGYFGWGTTTAITPHHIHSAAADGFTHYTTGLNTAANRGFDSGIASNGSAYAWLYENSYYQIATNNASRFYIGSDGIVNIGQSSTQTVAQFFIKNTLSSYEVARLKGHASQTGGYFNIVTSADASLFSVDVSGNVFVSGASADFYIENQRRLILRDSDNSNHVSLKSPATVASNVDLTLPDALPSTAGQVIVTDTSGVMSFNKTEIILSTTAGIDGTSAVATTLYTVPSGRKAVITKAIVRCTTGTAITAEGYAGIGTNGNYDNIFSSLQLLGVDATDKGFVFQNVLAGFTIADQNLAIKFEIDTAFTATTTTLAIDLIGYLV